MQHLDVDFSQYANRLQVKLDAGRRLVYDPVRKGHFALTPEEMIRQLVIRYLLEEKQYNRNRLQVEKALRVNGLLKRFDLLVYDDGLAPFLLVECKAPEVPFSQSVFDQLARYNLSLQAPFLLATNGRQSYCCEVSFETGNYVFLPSVPDWLSKR